MSERRLSLVKHAFHFLDVENHRILPLTLLKKSFKADAHPRVRSRQKTASQVQEEFERSIIKKRFFIKNSFYFKISSKLSKKP